MQLFLKNPKKISPLTENPEKISGLREKSENFFLEKYVHAFTRKPELFPTSKKSHKTQ